MSYLADYTHPGPIRAALASLVPVVCPPEAIELGLVDDIVDEVELAMRASPAGVRAALLAGLTGYEVTAIAYPAHLGKRASQLSGEQARAYFESWLHSRLMPQHEFAKGIKGLICLSCYEQPAMMATIGYTPQEWIDKSVKYRLTTYAEAIAKREVDLIAPDPLPNVAPKKARSQ
jgi:hypothetical protein